MPKIVLGAIFLVLAGISFWDGQRITQNLRKPGVYDSLGPDRYLMLVGAILLILGVAVAVQGARERRAAVATQESGDPVSQRHWWLLATVCAYSALIWFVGYAAATLVFFIAALWIMGQRDWRWNVPSAVALTAAYYFMFQYAADISLPQGIFG